MRRALDHDSGEVGPQRRSAWRVAGASLIGTTIEWYDFFLYATAAALIFNDLFFPGLDETAGMMASLATIAVAFIARPVGSVIFGHLGDRIGRKRILVATVGCMGGATFLIGLLPPYSSIGVAAPLCLVVLRFVQGIAVSGEWGAAVVMAVEYAPASRRGLFGSFPQIGAPAGLVLSTGAFSLVSALPADQFISWGWRLPFLASIVLIAVALYIRLRIAESPVFEMVRAEQKIVRNPITDVIRTNPRSVLVAMGARVADNGIYYLLATFSLMYATTQLGMARESILNAVFIASIVWLFAIPAYGALSDRLGRKRIYLFGAIGLGLFAFPFFEMLETRSFLVTCIAIILGLALFHAAMYGPQGALFSEMFDARNRYSGATLGYNLATIFVGGPAPFVAAALLQARGGDPLYVAIYMIVMALITIVSMAFIRETRTVDLADVGTRQRQHDKTPAVIAEEQ